MPEKTHRTEFEFEQLAAVCLKRWWVVAGCVLAGFLAALLICTCLIAPLYWANVSFYVSAGDGTQESLSASDLTAACLLADTCIGLLDTDTVLERMAATAEAALAMHGNGEYGNPVPNYGESISGRVVKIIQSYTSIVNQTVWHK